MFQIGAQTFFVHINVTNVLRMTAEVTGSRACG